MIGVLKLKKQIEVVHRSSRRKEHVMMIDLIQRLKGRLVVSCQSFEGEPLYGSNYMVAMAKSAVLGGAGGIRANGPEDIRAIKETVDLPVIGIYKQQYPGYEVRITPSAKEVLAIAEAGADIIAVDATKRPRPGSKDTEEFLQQIRKLTDKPIMADISTLDEAIMAEQVGFDIVATTLSGYTEYTQQFLEEQPNYDLLEQVIRSVSIPVMAEGRFWEPVHVVKALAYGAWAVTVGGAITRPHLITERFVKYMKVN